MIDIKFQTEKELQIDLAKYLREVGYLTFTEIELKSKGGGRADIVAVKPSYANKDCRIYEVKNNRSTFLSDEKYMRYFDVCHRLYIACPRGLIKKNELPEKVGLITRGEKGWHVVKGARRNEPKDFNINFALSLLYRGYEETLHNRQLRDRIVLKDNVELASAAKNIGYKIGRRLRRTQWHEVERWVNDLNELFTKFFGENIVNGYEKLPDLWQLEKLLESVQGYTDDIQHIKDIGYYLQNLDLPEEKEGYGRGRRELREKAMEFKEEDHD